MRKGKEKMNFIWFVVCDARSTIGELNQITLRVILFKPPPPLSRSLQNPQSFWSKIRISMFTVRNSIQTESLLLAAFFHQHCFFVSIALVLSPLIFIGSHRNTGDEKKRVRAIKKSRYLFGCKF